MEELLQIIDNIVVTTNGIILKIAVPVLLILLIFDAIRYAVSKDGRKEALSAMRAKVIGFVLLIFMPFIFVALMGFLEKVSGVKPNVDMSIVDRLLGKKTSVTSNTTPSNSVADKSFEDESK